MEGGEMPQENLEQQVAGLEKRLDEVERRSRGRVRFFTQYLLSPVLVAGLAAGLNFYYQGQLENQRKKLEEQRNTISQYELVNKMLPQLVHSNTQVAEATRVVLEHVITDTKLREQLNKVFKENVLAQKMSELDVAAPQQRELIVRQTAQLVPQIEPQLNRYEDALRLEGNGFDALVKGDVDGAIRAFEQVQEAYPGYHNAAEIAALLRENRERWEEPRVQQQVYRTIVLKYFWKAPKLQIEELRKRLR